MAAAHGPLELLKSLIMERGIDTSEVDADGWRPLHIAIKGGREQEAFFLINEAPGVDIDALDAHTQTALILAAGRGDVAVMQALVAKGADVNARTGTGTTALLGAISRGHEEAALYLVEEAVAAVYNPDAPAIYDPDAPESALAYAATFSMYRVIRAIVRRMRADGMDSTAVAAEMGVAARCAIEEKDLESLKALVEEGLDVYQTSPMKCENGSNNEHPLFQIACFYGKREAATFLVERGCDPLAHNGCGQRAHHVLAAYDDGLPKLKWLMASFPIPVDNPMTSRAGVIGTTMLHFAAAAGRLETVQWLVGEGADVLCAVHGSGPWGRDYDGIEVRRGEGVYDRRRLPAGEGGGSAGCMRGGGAAGAEREAAPEAEEGQGAPAGSGGGAAAAAAGGGTRWG